MFFLAILILNLGVKPLVKNKKALVLNKKVLIRKPDHNYNHSIIKNFCFVLSTDNVWFKLLHLETDLSYKNMGSTKYRHS